MFHHVSTDRSGTYLSGSKDDLAAIFSYQWKSPRHMREAIKLLLASYLDEGDVETRGDVLAHDDSDYQVERIEAQLQLANNPASNSALLEYLRRQQPGIRVLERIATNPGCMEETLIKLAHHKSPDVRAAVTENVSCSPALYLHLSKDDHPDVRYRMAENPVCGTNILLQLSEDENPFVATRAQETLKRMSSAVVVGRFPATAEQNRLRIVGE